MSATPAPALIEMTDAAVAALSDSALTLLDQVNWTVRPGEFWVVAGLHHSGKSDLLQHAAGLVAPASGSCRVLGVETTEFGEAHLAERLRIGFTFADGKLFGQLTLAENVALPLHYHRNLPADETGGTLAALFALLELTPHANKHPGYVPLVWRQRAALARALVLRPELLLLDNPLAGLTARDRQWLVHFLDQLWQGHEFFGGRPMTIAATTDDLHGWQHPQRRFAAVHEGTFSRLGAWGGKEFTGHPAVRDMLSMPAETGSVKRET